MDLQDDGQVLKVIVALAGLKTGIALRDRHLREKYLETDRFPDAVLEVPWSALSLPEEGARTEASARGRLTLHGTTREVDFTYRIHRTAGAYQVTGRLPFRMTDYAIHKPGYLGVTVRPELVTSISFQASTQGAQR